MIESEGMGACEKKADLFPGWTGRNLRDRWQRQKEREKMEKKLAEMSGPDEQAATRPQCDKAKLEVKRKVLHCRLEEMRQELECLECLGGVVAVEQGAGEEAMRRRMIKNLDGWAGQRLHQVHRPPSEQATWYQHKLERIRDESEELRNKRKILTGELEQPLLEKFTAEAQEKLKEKVKADLDEVHRKLDGIRKSFGTELREEARRSPGEGRLQWAPQQSTTAATDQSEDQSEPGGAENVNASAADRKVAVKELIGSDGSALRIGYSTEVCVLTKFWEDLLGSALASPGCLEGLFSGLGKMQSQPLDDPVFMRCLIDAPPVLNSSVEELDDPADPRGQPWPALLSRRREASVVLAAPMLLEHASAAVRDDVVVMLAAVRRNGLALQFGSDFVRCCPAVVEAAVRQNGEALRYVPSTRQSIASRAASLEQIKHSQDQWAGRSAYHRELFGGPAMLHEVIAGPYLGKVGWLARPEDHWGAGTESLLAARKLRLQEVPAEKNPDGHWVTVDRDHLKPYTTRRRKELQPETKLEIDMENWRKLEKLALDPQAAEIQSGLDAAKVPKCNLTAQLRPKNGQPQERLVEVLGLALAAWLQQAPDKAENLNALSAEDRRRLVGQAEAVVDLGRRLSSLNLEKPSSQDRANLIAESAADGGPVLTEDGGAATEELRRLLAAELRMQATVSLASFGNCEKFFAVSGTPVQQTRLFDLTATHKLPRKPTGKPILPGGALLPWRPAASRGPGCEPA